MDHEHDTKKGAEERVPPRGSTIDKAKDAPGMPPEDTGHASEAKRDDTSGAAAGGPVGAGGGGPDDAAEADDAVR
jgi:hypothetical protein